MLSKCANPDCNLPFHYMREGRLYKFELTPAEADAGQRKSARRVEHFWLCGRCAASMILVLENRQVVVAPLRRAYFKRAAS